MIGQITGAGGHWAMKAKFAGNQFEPVFSPGVT